MLHHRRKIIRLGYMTVCVMCALAVYLVFWDKGLFHSEGVLPRHDSHDGVLYDMYGANYRHRGKGGQPEQLKGGSVELSTPFGQRNDNLNGDNFGQRPDDFEEDNPVEQGVDTFEEDSPVDQRDDTFEGDNPAGQRGDHSEDGDISWIGVEDGGFGNKEDQHFNHEYPVVPLPAMKELQPHPVQAYVDTELSENFMDIHEMDGVDVKSVEDIAVEFLGNKGNSKDFHYPDMGYRYQGVLKNVQNNPAASQFKPIQTHGGKSLTPKAVPDSRNSNSHIPQSSVSKNHVINSNLNSYPVKKQQDKKPLPNSVFPPPLVSSQLQGQLNTRYLVYLCDSLSMCGGWGDRQRGMVSTYLLSRLVGRQFRIIMSTPCDLSYFYVPRKVQWQPVMDELVTDSNTTINAISNKKFQHHIMEGDFNKRYSQRVVYLKTNQDYYERMKKNPFYAKILQQWGGLSSKRGRFQWAWNDLMQPSAMVLSHLEHIVGTQFLINKGLILKPANTELRILNDSTHNVGNSTLICAHVRIGRNPTIPMDEEFPSFKLEDLPVLFNFMLSKDLAGDAKFFVATDNEDTRVESRKFFGERAINYGGKIMHIDRQRVDHGACVGFEVAAMDQLILSLCDVLVVSRSGFSIHASFVNNSTRPVYIMEDGVIERFTS